LRRHHDLGELAACHVGRGTKVTARARLACAAALIAADGAVSNGGFDKTVEGMARGHIRENTDRPRLNGPAPTHDAQPPQWAARREIVGPEGAAGEPAHPAPAGERKHRRIIVIGQMNISETDRTTT